jgi:hypothetical protein
MANNITEYQKLRSFLNPSIRGRNVDSVLNALATGTGYLVQSVEQVNAQLFITTASAQYLDLLLGQYGITRPPSVGISDEIFREIGLQVKNRKQVRDLIENLLNAIFGDQFTKAYDSSTMPEPYDLSSGDTLIVQFDGGSPITIPFQTGNFVDIHNATAIEVADAIVSYLTSQNLTGSATIANNGLGNYVQIFSSTLGPRSSVSVLGGSAQNVLVFPSTVPAGGNASTQWTLSTQSDGKIRFTWSGGANPNLGKLAPGNYVNIYGGGFASSSNIGTYTILDNAGGLVDEAYFDIYNPIGTTGSIIQATDSAVLFFNPVKSTVQSNEYYAALYQTETNVVQIFLPATTRVVRRGRIGSAHLHDPPRGTFTLLAQPNSGDVFYLTSSVFVTTGVNFAVGATLLETVQNIVAAINDLNAGMVGIVNVIDEQDIVYVQNDSLANSLTITYSGSANIIASGPQGFNISLEPNQQGPYIYDTSQPFTVAAINTVLTDDVNSSTGRVMIVENSSQFPNSTGYVVFDYGGETQELAQYTAIPSNDTILLSPINNLQFDHPAGQNVTLIESKSPVNIPRGGTGYDFIITDVVGGRIYCEDLIQQVIAAGITLNFVVLYPDDIGLGKAGTPNSEIVYVYGPDPQTVVYPENDLTQE